MNLLNKQFGDWTVMSLAPKKNGRIYWHCKCMCGVERDVLQGSLTTGKSTGCGCSAKKNKYYSDISNQTFGALTAVEKTDKRDNGSIIWKCQCECGNIVYWDSSRLKQTKNPHCGCKKSLVGEMFGKLRVISEAPSRPQNRNLYWRCQCECGNFTEVSTGDLRSGNIIGCGCTKSIGEYNIAKILSENNVNYQNQYSFNDLRDKRLLKYDFAILDENNEVIKLIEFDGLQHSSPSEKWFSEGVAKHDIMKNEYAKSHDIPLLRIPYNMRDKMTLEYLLS